MHKPDCPRLCRSTRSVAVALSVLLVAFLCAPGLALADGDPASDVLLDQDAFLPQDSDANATQQARLGAVLESAARHGYPIRVAVIASPSDLGSITELWGQPEAYARFLDVELSLAFHGRVLVVMPNGLGLAATTRLRPTEQQVIANAPAPRARSELTSTAELTVGKLAAAAGHPLPASVAPVSAPAEPTPHGNSIALLVFLLGLLMIAVAWTFSLRAKPFRLGGRDEPAS